MAFEFSNDAKERVRQAVDIVELVGGYYQLRRQGRDFVALCPWHDDTRPSLTVNPERQTYKCWVCDTGGDIFSFVMRVEGVEFPEALRMLADRAGIPLGNGGSSGPSADLKRTLYEAVAWAEQQFRRYLMEASEAEPARAYLAGRGVAESMVDQFRVGFCPNSWDWLLGRARDTRFGPDLLEKAGLVVPRREGSGYYDRFRGRVMFPIRDAQDRPVAFGGRILPEYEGDRTAKYMNSNDTPIFSKSQLVYGLNIARDAISRSRTVLVTEGYTDCIAAHQHGFANTVAILGTALGERHIQLLRRFADSIVLVLDGDEAGVRRTNEILELFVERQVDLRVLTLPEGADPCDYLSAHGAEAFEAMIGGAVDALEHRLRTVTIDVDGAVETHRSHQAMEDVLVTLAKASGHSSAGSSVAIRVDQVLQRLVRQFGVSEERLRARMAELRRGAKPAIGPTGTGDGAESGPIRITDPWQRELALLLVARPAALAEIRGLGEVQGLPAGPCRRIVEAILTMLDRDEAASFDQLMLAFDDHEMKNLLVTLDAEGEELSPGRHAARLQELLEHRRRYQEDLDQRRSLSVLKEGAVDEATQMQMLERMIEQKRARQSVPRVSPTDG